MRRQFRWVRPDRQGRGASALAGLVALLGLVDDVDPALAAHELVVAVAPAQGFERVANLHRRCPGSRAGRKEANGNATKGPATAPGRRSTASRARAASYSGFGL